MKRTKLLEALQELEAGSAPSPCVSTALRTYRHARLTPGHLKPKTIGEYERALDRLERALGDREVHSLTTRDLDQYLATIRPGSRPNHFSAISAAFKWLDANGYPGLGAIIPRRRPRSRPRDFALSDAQYGDLARALADARHKHWARPRTIDVITFGVLVPLRISEIVTLRWPNVDLGSKSVRLYDTKTGDRAIPLPTVATTLLARQPRGGTYCWPRLRNDSEEEQQHVDAGAVSKAFRKICDRAGMPRDLVFHGLRHSWATKAIREGVPMEWVRRMLGHTTDYMTARYVHLNSADLRRELERVEQAMLHDAEQLEALWS